MSTDFGLLEAEGSLQIPAKEKETEACPCQNMKKMCLKSANSSFSQAFSKKKSMSSNGGV